MNITAVVDVVVEGGVREQDAQRSALSNEHAPGRFVISTCYRERSR